jgi:hypothetical protein
VEVIYRGGRALAALHRLRRYTIMSWDTYTDGQKDEKPLLKRETTMMLKYSSPIRLLTI